MISRLDQFPSRFVMIIVRLQNANLTLWIVPTAAINLKLRTHCVSLYSAHVKLRFSHLIFSL